MLTREEARAIADSMEAQGGGALVPIGRAAGVSELIVSVLPVLVRIRPFA